MKLSEKRRARPRAREYVRYFCVHCDGRVLPYDSFEALTEAPKPGVSGNPVLLYTYNSRRAELGEDQRSAWCFRCDRIVEGKREGKMEIMLRYLRRRGVTFRAVNVEDEGAMVKALNRKMQQRKGVGVIQLSERMGGGRR